MENEMMDLQQLSFFTEGNTFTGGRTKDTASDALLRYLVRPDKENGALVAYVWHTDFCFECAQEKIERTFPMNEKGLEEIQEWLQEQYRAI